MCTVAELLGDDLNCLIDVSGDADDGAVCVKLPLGRAFFVGDAADVTVAFLFSGVLAHDVAVVFCGVTSVVDGELPSIRVSVRISSVEWYGAVASTAPCEHNHKQLIFFAGIPTFLVRLSENIQCICLLAKYRTGVKMYRV